MLFFACALVVLAGYRLWAYLRDRFGWTPKPRAAVHRDASVAFSRPAVALPVSRAPRDTMKSALGRVGNAQDLHALASRQIDSAEYLLLRLRGDLDSMAAASR